MPTSLRKLSGYVYGLPRARGDWDEHSYPPLLNPIAHSDPCLVLEVVLLGSTSLVRLRLRGLEDAANGSKSMHDGIVNQSHTAFQTAQTHDDSARYAAVVAALAY